jgi:hypothetical protein
VARTIIAENEKCERESAEIESHRGSNYVKVLELVGLETEKFRKQGCNGAR